jgi:hypothetical protein
MDAEFQIILTEPKASGSNGGPRLIIYTRMRKQIITLGSTLCWVF